MKELSGIIKPFVQQSSITWTAEVDEAIMRMIADCSSHTKIALELGNGLKRSDIYEVGPSPKAGRCLRSNKLSGTFVFFRFIHFFLEMSCG